MRIADAKAPNFGQLWRYESPPTTKDVEPWKINVDHLLKDRDDLLSLFHYAPPKLLGEKFSMTCNRKGLAVNMNLEAQIALITVPQEFSRLCNAVLSAEHGDDYLPIDDDRPDRGNDGFLKSEKRAFAVHCFKRIQNQSLDKEVRRKLLGDLGKAITLKEQGLWDVEAWTFLSNYPIDEAIGRAAVQLATGTGIDVSWRGPGFLASALQRHAEIQELFPTLQVNEIAGQLKDLKEAVKDGNSSPIEVEVPGRVPRTSQEQHALLTVRPDGWEYLLYASVLLQGKEALEMRWHDHELPPYRPKQSIPDVGEASSYLGQEFQRMTTMIEALMLVFADDAQERAFGAPGEPGDPVRIEHLATRVVQSYEEILRWAADLRAIDPPPVLVDVFEIAPHMADAPLMQFRIFVDEVVEAIDRIPAFLENHESDNEPLRISLALTLALDQEVKAEFDRRIKRARRKTKWGF